MEGEARFCESCGKKLERKRYNGRLEDRTRFKKRRFCSLSCANKKREVTTVETTGESTPRNPQQPEQQAPLEYMLGVMNDPDADPDRRDTMAKAAAPYVHEKPAQSSSKKHAQQQAASRVASGRFASGAAPKVIQGGKK